MSRKHFYSLKKFHLVLKLDYVFFFNKSTVSTVSVYAYNVKKYLYRGYVIASKTPINTKIYYRAIKASSAFASNLK